MESEVRTTVKKCLGYKRGETLLIVCDRPLADLARGFYKASLKARVKALFFEIPAAGTHGQEPHAALAAALKEADLALLFTSMSLSHTRARKIASKKYGTRIASLPGITRGILKRWTGVNHEKLKKGALRVSRLLSRARHIRITAKKGTDLTFSVKKRKGFADTGFYTRRGAFGNLPGGEACVAPVEGTANGRLIVDASAPFAGKLKKPLEILIKKGYAVNIPLFTINRMIRHLGKPALNVAEFGIGLNPGAKITGNILEDEKCLGSAHIAFGNNQSFGGHVGCPSHLDFVFLKPVILLDGKELRL